MFIMKWLSSNRSKYLIATGQNYLINPWTGGGTGFSGTVFFLAYEVHLAYISSRAAWADPALPLEGMPVIGKIINPHA